MIYNFLNGRDVRYCVYIVSSFTSRLSPPIEVLFAYTNTISLVHLHPVSTCFEIYAAPMNIDILMVDTS